MGDSPKRKHIEQLAKNSPEVGRAFAMICAILMASNAKDLECDIQFGDKQYHFDVSEVAKLEGTIA